MAKKHTNLYYKFNKEPLEDKHEDWLPLYLDNKGLDSSCWFKDLHVNISKYLVGKYIPSIRKFIAFLAKHAVHGDAGANDLLMNNPAFGTAKTCPGVKGILKNSVVVKSPCDIHISMSSTGGWVYRVPNPDLIELTEDHGYEQFVTENEKSNIFKDYRVIKFKLPISAGTDGEPYIHLAPQFHNTHKFQVVNGVIDEISTEMAPINIITIVKMPPEGETLTIDINAGDALAYLWNEKPLKLKHNPDLIPFFGLHRHFINSFGRYGNKNSSN